MDKNELRDKRTAVRQQIKERMQQELEQRKKAIKARLKKENVSVQEKRRRYREEVNEEKLALVKLAKEEFQARKRMLGLAQEELEEAASSEPPPIPSYLQEDVEPPFLSEEEPPPSPSAHLPDPPDDKFAIERSPRIRPEEAFVYEDKENSDAKELHAPIDASDMLPLGVVEADAGPDGAAIAKEVTFDLEERKSLFYYIINLVIHPVQTLDEFDDYLRGPANVVKVVLFYLLSLLPIVGFMFFGEEIASGMAARFLGSTTIGSALHAESDIALMLLTPVLGLLTYTGAIALVNYFFADDAKFLTLLTYFAFVEAETRLVIYSLLVVTAFIAVMTSANAVALAVVALLFFILFVWWFCLDIIVLMSAYGYEWYSAIALVIGGFVLQNILRVLVLSSFLAY